MKAQSAAAQKLILSESKEEAGIRLAEYRMSALRKRLKSVGNIGNYPIGEKRIEKLCETLDGWVNETKILLRNHKKDETDRFEF